MTIGQTIRERRVALGLSLRSAAKSLGVNPSYLSRVESDKAAPSGRLLTSLADLLRYPAEELILVAGRLPPSLREAVEKDPRRTVSALTEAASLIISESPSSYNHTASSESRRAIEDDFPFEYISDIAELESWRKEVNRPIYHVHKWWAQRLGSVFRSILLSACAPATSSVADMFHQRMRFPGVVVFDPFMGSGTTVGEAYKLGCSAIGWDINPVAYRAARIALGPIDRDAVVGCFSQLAEDVGVEIREIYRSFDSTGAPCDVLYYFWVMCVACPQCQTRVDLFSKYEFARHADRRRSKATRVICRQCDSLIDSTVDSIEVSCGRCGDSFNPHIGPVRRTTASCSSCSHEFRIAPTIKQTGSPPQYRMYAKLVLKDDGTKEYLPITKFDLDRFEDVRRQLWTLNPKIPQVKIVDGHNTRQILNYGFERWHQLFNERQLFALTRIARSIQKLPEGSASEALSILWSGTLEFNNMFASYKGEGTGAIRHMFAHHILKPERTPIEGNPWGTPKSSGAFSTLFKSRLMRAIDYQDSPFEIAVNREGLRPRGRKVAGINRLIGQEPITKEYPASGLRPGSLYMACGDSANTDIPNEAVDLVVTDPPFFDNVHYSELADFFHVWQDLYFPSDVSTQNDGTTRVQGEVQDVDPSEFSRKLCDVFKECRRVLRSDGLMVFTFHHSRIEGWLSVAQAVLESGFSFVQSHPIRSEMSVAAPKSQAREPINIDLILVCRKRVLDRESSVRKIDPTSEAAVRAAVQLTRFNNSGRWLSRNDMQSLILGQALVLVSEREATDVALDQLLEASHILANATENLWCQQEHAKQAANTSDSNGYSGAHQLFY